MKLTKEQANQLQEKLAGKKDPEEIARAAKELGIDISAEDMKKVLENVNGMQTLSDDETVTVSGGYIEGDIPPAALEAIRMAYEMGGPQLAFPTCIYYIPSPLCYEIIRVLEAEMGLFY